MADKYGHYVGGKYSVDVSANPLLWFNFDLMNQGAIATLVSNEAAIKTLADDGERGQMRTALHALRRAAEAVLFEDQLLESWVVIESLLGAEVPVLFLRLTWKNELETLSAPSLLTIIVNRAPWIPFQW